MALTAALLAVAFAVPARANTGDIVAPSDPNNPTVDSGWQAGTCNNERPEAGTGATATNFCSVDTPTQFFEQAGGHPQWGFTQIIVNHEPSGEPLGELKTVRVDLPVGLSVNPQATPQCSKEEFEVPGPLKCPGAEVGKSLVWVWVPLLGEEKEVPPATVYNIKPVNGEAARFGFELGGKFVYLQADVAWESDYHEGFTIHVPTSQELSSLFGSKGLVTKNRFVFDGRSGNGTFITTPTTCLGPPTAAAFEHTYSTWLRADSYDKPDPSFPSGSTAFESPIPDFTYPKQCDSIPFDPSLEVGRNTSETDSPSGATIDVKLPFEEPDFGAPPGSPEAEEQASSQLKTAKVTLPPGMGLNPSAATGLVACTDEEFGKGTRNPVECPPASKIGTVTVQTPPLPDPLAGNVYLGQQLSRDPSSGDEYRVFADVESTRYGISARLIGNVAADSQTGQLTGTFADNPQVPFSSFTLHFDGGARATLTSPPTCGPHLATGEMTPWSATPGTIPAGTEGGPSSAPPATPSSEFTLSEAPGGGACPETLAARPFAPGFAAKAAKPQAGAFSAFRIDLTRPPGQQELKGATVEPPPGVTGKLAGVTYCPEAAIAAAAANGGAAETAHPSCPASSLVGAATVLAGSGPEPLQIGGKAFLAGPYHGAPLSLAVVTPATAGPFDLGSVVVRVALFVDPSTARIRAVSDPIPHVFGGALLDIRSISLDLDRHDFSLNPTNCSPMTAAGTLLGGGADPTSPAAFSAFSVSAPFQVSGCDKLGFEPKLFLRVLSGTRRTKHPKLRAVFAAREGDANPARVAVTLPRGLFLDQASISRVCTRVQFAAHECPRGSVYGFARAYTPLLDRPLEGPVYLRSSDNPLPDLVAALHGQVDIELDGRTDTVRGRLRNTFDTIPDVPVSKFVLTLRGGRSGLLVNSRSLCPRRRHHHRKAPPPLRAIARIAAQNGKTANQRPKLRVPCRRRH